MLLFHNYCFFIIDILMENLSHHSNSSSSSSSSEDEDTKLEVTRVLKKRLVVLLLKLLSDSSIDKERVSTSSFTGSLFIQELLNGSSSTCYELMRMEKHGFISLCHMFREKGWLVDSKHLNVEEKMAMFLMTISHNLQNRLIKNRFQHSSQTIHKYFHEVLVAMVNFSKEMITPPSFNDSSNGISNRRLRQIFKDAVGAIDGTLIHACIPTNQQVPYRGCGRGECFQNVMAVCDFDMIFRFVVVGWEGTAHDSRVLTETIRNPQHNFPMPPSEKYYLVDAAYTHTRGFMAPYRNVRYWLSDFRSGGKAVGKEEIFNQCHARLRNVIERAFGVVKARFPILKRMTPYSFTTQTKIVMTCFSIHNFLRQISVADRLFSEYDNEVELESDNANQNQTSTISSFFAASDQEFMQQFRNQIANELFQVFS
ncbi:uncharacterized protein LOC104880679 isoform X1 [Vitis vinifera]|uniref:uncharacterized protein LOC104880679 isoform X1 n=2 Tax=Vitis vinifera TaxID=29760 RepID=UPI002882F420|nr:uncharacterized protein LOC104880679 isoform X1 [Vitis vinifera]